MYMSGTHGTERYAKSTSAGLIGPSLTDQWMLDFCAARPGGARKRRDEDAGSGAWQLWSLARYICQIWRRQHPRTVSIHVLQTKGLLVYRLVHVVLTIQTPGPSTGARFDSGADLLFCRSAAGCSYVCATTRSTTACRLPLCWRRELT